MLLARADAAKIGPDRQVGNFRQATTGAVYYTDAVVAGSGRFSINGISPQVDMHGAVTAVELYCKLLTS